MYDHLKSHRRRELALNGMFIDFYFLHKAKKKFVDFFFSLFNINTVTEAEFI